MKNLNADGLLDEIITTCHRWDSSERIYYCEACENEWDEEHLSDPSIHQPLCLTGITVRGLIAKYDDNEEY